MKEVKFLMSYVRKYWRGKMICEICKKKIRKPSETPEEAMRKFALKLKKENEKIKKEKNGTSK